MASPTSTDASTVPDSPCASHGSRSPVPSTLINALHADSTLDARSRSASSFEPSPNTAYFVDPLEADHPLGALARLDQSILDRAHAEASSSAHTLSFPDEEAIRALLSGSFPFEPSPWLLALIAARERLLRCLQETADQHRRAHHHPHRQAHS
jgi:hypothetical protein